jgi:hypothetical protein
MHIPDRIITTTLESAPEDHTFDLLLMTFRHCGRCRSPEPLMLPTTRRLGSGSILSFPFIALAHRNFLKSASKLPRILISSSRETSLLYVSFTI